jgi:uncharacterized protein (DUF2237 family)
VTCEECGAWPAYETTGDPVDPWPLCAVHVQEMLHEAMELDRDLRAAWAQLLADLADQLDMDRGLARILDGGQP